jgi:DNA-binding NarL/FixJ family response regulator
MIKILIADDHGIVRAGLKLFIERLSGMQVVGEAADGREALRLSHQLRPDVIVMDIAMPLLNGLDAATQMIRKNEQVGVILLSMHADESYVLRAPDAGARDTCSRSRSRMKAGLAGFSPWQIVRAEIVPVLRVLDGDPPRKWYPIAPILGLVALSGSSLCGA